MDERQNFSLSTLLPLAYLILLLYGVAALILLPFGLPLLRKGEAFSVFEALSLIALCAFALYFIQHSVLCRAISSPVRKAAQLSAAVIILSFASYITTVSYFSVKPAIGIVNHHNYDAAFITIERWLFGGILPSLWLIERVDGWQLTALDISYHLFMPFLAFSLMVAVYYEGLKGGQIEHCPISRIIHLFDHLAAVSVERPALRIPRGFHAETGPDA
jgi:hypothetical protein